MHDIDDTLHEMETTLTMQQQQLPTGTLEATGVAAAVAEIAQLRTQLNMMVREVEIVQTIEPAKPGTARGGPSSRHSPRRGSAPSRRKSSGAPYSRRKSSGARGPPPPPHRQASSDVSLRFGEHKSAIIPPPPPPSDPAPFRPTQELTMTQTELPLKQAGGIFRRIGSALGMHRDSGRQGSDIQLRVHGHGEQSQPAPPAPWWTDDRTSAPPPPPPEVYVGDQPHEPSYAGSYAEPHYDPYYSERDSPRRMPDNLA